MKSKIQKLTQLQHVLKRPDMYIGTLKDITASVFIVRNGKMKREGVTFNSGILKLFDEIILNACDHAIDHPGVVTNIKVEVDSDKGIVIHNNGKGIPVEKYSGDNVDGDIYLPELIFTHFLTSSNYDDTQTRIKSGLNGLGAKLTSAFSKKFIVETVCDGIFYKQVYKNNLKEISLPKIKDINQKDYTRITFIPDFKRFGCESINGGTKDILERRSYDIAMNTKANVYFNGSLLNVKTFKDYVKLFPINLETETTVIQSNEYWDVAIASSTNEEYSGISFVNGVHTLDDGTHVNYILNQLYRIYAQKLKIKTTPNMIKDQLFIIVSAKIVNPTFKSQAKEELTTSSRDFGSVFTFNDKSCRGLVKLDCIERLKSLAEYKLTQKLSKQDKKKTKRLYIPHLDDAIQAGGKKSEECTLILTEGLSAKTFAIAGLSVVGRDLFGVFPLKGKLLNVRGCTTQQLINNQEIQNIRKILGLQMKTQGFKDLKQNLRYGKVCLLCDADTDGQHIQGLLLNFFHKFWPELLKHGFVSFLRTPIVKVTTTNAVKYFFTPQSYDKFKRKNDTSKFVYKYYKGLGSSTSKEAKEIFKGYYKNVVNFKYSPVTDNKSFNLAFDKTKSTDRKLWIQKHTGKNLELIVKGKPPQVSIESFFNTAFVSFSIADCVRSIPNIMDGFKPTQRKIIHSFLKKGYKEFKVDQIRGFIAEQTLYAHGEMSLNESIISMNHDFVGSNNINLLIPCGAFGSRILGGKDAASPRYISTKLNPIVTNIFRDCDTSENVIEYNTEGDHTIEPKFFVPVIPMILVNGSTGIGTGYSTDIPCYNPIDLVTSLTDLLDSKRPKDLIPWYRDFKGMVIKGEHGYFSQGMFNIVKNTITITELPIGVWTDKYKEYLESLVQKGVLKNILNYSTEKTIHFVVTLKKKADEIKDIDSVLKLIQPIKFNLTCFNANEELRVYKSANEVLKEFYTTRLEYYKKRKTVQLNHLKDEYTQLHEKMRFINLVINSKIKVFRKTKDQVVEQIKKHRFKLAIIDTLLEIKITQFTSDYVHRLGIRESDCKTELKNLESLSAKDLFRSDLDQFIESYTAEK